MVHKLILCLLLKYFQGINPTTNNSTLILEELLSVILERKWHAIVHNTNEKLEDIGVATSHQYDHIVVILKHLGYLKYNTNTLSFVPKNGIH